MPYNFDRKKLSKNVWVLPSLFCLCFLVNSKKQFHPFELLGHKVDTEVTVKFETASDFDQEWNLGEIQCSMTKVVFVLDFWL